MPRALARDDLLEKLVDVGEQRLLKLVDEDRARRVHREEVHDPFRDADLAHERHHRGVRSTICTRLSVLTTNVSPCTRNAPDADERLATGCSRHGHRRTLAHCEASRTKIPRKSAHFDMLYSPRQPTSPGDQGKWVRIPHGVATVSGESALALEGSPSRRHLEAGADVRSAVRLAWEGESADVDPQVRIPGHWAVLPLAHCAGSARHTPRRSR